MKKKTRQRDGQTDFYVKFTLQILHLREITVVIFLDMLTAFECPIVINTLMFTSMHRFHEYMITNASKLGKSTIITVAWSAVKYQEKLRHVYVN